MYACRMQDAALFLLMYVVFPLWVAAGFADWACHARTGIAVTSGMAENVLHWVMYAEIGVGIAAVAYFELNAAVLGIVLAVFVVHEATVYGELRYSTIRRDVAPFEQMVHSFMELLPFVSLLLLAIVAWPIRMDDWSLQLRREPWPVTYMAVALAASFLFNAVPLAQETASCMRGRKQREGAYAPRVEPHL
jgi:hypothetical protein